ncbi:hypothetical protein CYMTET_29931, partial [Cymbomonas tetramitiformis]
MLRHVSSKNDMLGCPGQRRSIGDLEELQWKLVEAAVESYGCQTAFQMLGRLNARLWESQNKYFESMKSQRLPMFQTETEHKSHWSLVKNAYQSHHLREVLSERIRDPWEGRHIEFRPAEHAKRHRYNPRSCTWFQDEIVVKIENSPFAAGAMRECFAMKKLASISSSWKKSANYVAKRYKVPVDKQVYLDDIKLQMDAKHFGEEFNKLQPPKQIDVIQCYLVEFHERANSPVYCVEHLVEGNYIKYNSNSGYVTDEVTDPRTTSCTLAQHGMSTRQGGRPAHHLVHTGTARHVHAARRPTRAPPRAHWHSTA